MKKADLSQQAAFTIGGGGCNGGGWVTGIRVNSSGNMVCRNDTQTAGFRAAGDTKWTQAYRLGENVPIGNLVFKGQNGWVYDIDLANTDNTVVMAANGRLMLSTDFCGTFTNLTTFKSGAYDATFGWYPDGGSRIGGAHIRIDPVNSSRIAVGHPIDGGYITLDKGATAFAIPASLPAPINTGGAKRGVHWAFDASSALGGSSQKVYCQIAGRGVYQATIGLGGAWTLLTGGPTFCSGIDASGGKAYFIGDSSTADTQLYVWSGSAWVQPSGVTGVSVTCHPTDSTKVICMRQGGGMFYSADSGVTWTLYDYPTTITATDVPWLGKTNVAYMSCGDADWEVRSGVNRLIISMGVGVITYDNPPRLTALPYMSLTLGIKQLLMKNPAITPNGTLLICGEDRAVWRFAKGGYTKEASGHGPDYVYPIRHGCDVSFAPENENYVVTVHSPQAGEPDHCHISNDNGKTWLACPSRPALMQGGNVAVLAVNKFIWASTADGPLKTTLDGGVTFIDPVFRLTPGGTIVDMSTACWHHSYTYRRKILERDPLTPGQALAYCVGNPAIDNGVQDNQMRGVWETTDYGQNWVKVRAGPIQTRAVDYFASRMRRVPTNSTDVFWATSGNDGPSDGAGGLVPSPDGLYFSSDNMRTIITMAGFSEVEDIAFTPRPSSRTYPRLNVKGWRGSVYGIFTSDDFNRASPTAATWTVLTNGPEGRFDGDVTLVGDMNSYPGLIIIMASGGFYVYEDPVKLRAN